MAKEDAHAAAVRLGAYVTARRKQLDLTQAEVAKAADIGLSTYQKVEYGYRGNIRRDTRHGVESALQWAAGSIKEVLAGGEPTLIEGEQSATQPTTTNAAGDVIPASRYDKSGRDLVADAYERLRLIVEAQHVVMEDLERLLRDKDRMDDPMSDPLA